MTPGDTIVAPSSAVGAAARMIVRLSGPGALAAAGTVGDSLPVKGGSASRVRLRFGGVDVLAWVYVFRTPRSYTGEDLVEFHIPGNPVLARMLLDALVRAGARPAEAGEFTARAYFDGRIDLTEAEGVAATIAAHGEQELAAARQLLAGELARRLAPAMDTVAQTLALVEVGIDFADEDVSFLSSEQVTRRIGEAEATLVHLIENSARFERLGHEPRFVLVGRPNAGKSTLLNALAGRERAVASPVAGTTRDALSAEVCLPRGMVVVTDVAGLDDELSPHDGDRSGPAADVARRMRAAALRAVQFADHVVLVRDVTGPKGELPLPRRPDLLVHAKADLFGSCPEGDDRAPYVSARTGWNLPALRAAMDALAFGGSREQPGLALTARHLRCLDDARAALQRAAGAGGRSPEVLALELRDALDAMGAILGRVTPDDLLGRIFSSFCIGK